MISFANAKINIGLYVTGKRDDGYHNIETIFYPVKLYDVIEYISNDTFSFESLGQSIPLTDSNLCVKAYDILKAHHNVKPASIHLLKNIPIGAGLGGGSSDAAWILKIFNEQQGLNLTNSQLKNYAKQLGADCPFFINNQPIYAYDIGTSFEQIKLDLSSYYIVIVMPDVHISTKEAYENITPKETTIDLKKAIQLPVEEWKTYISNDFELYTIMKYPHLELLKNQLYEAGALYASMSGSGSSFFGIFKEPVQLPQLTKFGNVYYPTEL